MRLSNSFSARMLNRSLPNPGFGRWMQMWLHPLPVNSLRWKTCSPLEMSLVAGLLQNQSTLATMASTPRRSLKPKGNDDQHSSVDDSKYSPPPLLGPVGNPICRVDLCHADVAYSTGGHLSGWIQKWIGGPMAIRFYADRPERPATNAVDIRVNGSDQR